MAAEGRWSPHSFLEAGAAAAHPPDPAAAPAPHPKTTAALSKGCGYRTAFATAAGLVAALTRAHQENRLEEKLKQLVQPKLLILDEIGYLPLDRLGANLFFQLVSRRYERGSILLTSNQSLTGWGQVFGDQIIATALLDRLLHSTIINIKGESYRLKEKRKAGLLTRSEPFTAQAEEAAVEP